MSDELKLAVLRESTDIFPRDGETREEFLARKQREQQEALEQYRAEKESDQ
jgi:hypothetical protein